MQRLVEKAKANKVEFHIPVDFKTASKFSADAEVGEATLESGIPDGWMGRT